MKPSCPLHSLSWACLAGTTSASLPPADLHHERCPICSLLSSDTVCQLPDENALSETCLAAKSFPTRVAGQEVSLRAYLRSEGPETPQALCGFTRESLVPALPPSLHPLCLPLPQGSRAGTAGATTTPSTHTWNDTCQLGGTLVCEYSPIQRVGKARRGCWQGSNISQKPPYNIPTPPRHSVYIVFLCIWVKDVQYMSSLCSRFYIYNMNPLFSPSSPRLRRMPGCGVVGF